MMFHTDKDKLALTLIEEKISSNQGEATKRPASLGFQEREVMKSFPATKKRIVMYAVNSQTALSAAVMEVFRSFA